MALVGAGYIAVEMAGMFHHLGSETHLFIRHDKFLRNFDPMIQDKIVSEYKRQYVFLAFNLPLVTCRGSFYSRNLFIYSLDQAILTARL